MSQLPDPAQARFLLEAAALPTLELERRITERVIAAIPAERADYAPAEGARGALELARHIVAVELAFLEAVVTGAFPDLRGGLAEAHDPAAVAAFYGARAPALLTRLAAVPGERLLVPLDYKGVVRMPALGFVQFATHHTIHHRGQLSTYFRGMGSRAPAIYG